MARSIQRDKELETIHRGEQYRRAIQLYYRKFQRYPTSIDQLVNTNQIRFLRKKYTDPLTGQGRLEADPVWAGACAASGILRPAADGDGGVGGHDGLDVCADGGGHGCQWRPRRSGDDEFQQRQRRQAAVRRSGGMFGSSPSTPGTGFGSSAGSSVGIGVDVRQQPRRRWAAAEFADGQQFDLSRWAAAPAVPARYSTRASAGTSATTFGGGGPIVGFTLPVKKPSLIDYMKQTAYNHWEFNYDPMADQAQAMAGLGGGAGATNPNGTGSAGNSPSGTQRSRRTTDRR